MATHVLQSVVFGLTSVFCALTMFLFTDLQARIFDIVISEQIIFDNEIDDNFLITVKHVSNAMIQGVGNDRNYRRQDDGRSCKNSS